MSYSPPLGSAVRFQDRLAAYSPPGGGAVSFGGNAVTGHINYRLGGTATVRHGVVSEGEGAFVLAGSAVALTGDFPREASGSGKLLLSGQGFASRPVAVAGAGKIRFSGAGYASRGEIVTVAGKIVLGGYGAVTRGVVAAGVGKMRGLSGQGSVRRGVTVSGAGVLTLGGGASARPIGAHQALGSGKIALSGRAYATFPVDDFAEDTIFILRRQEWLTIPAN